MNLTTLVISTIFFILHLAAARPSNRQAPLYPDPKDGHVKRKADVVVTVIETIYPTDAPKFIVYVNQYGEPLYTVRESIKKVSHSSKHSTKHNTTTTHHTTHAHKHSTTHPTTHPTLESATQGSVKSPSAIGGPIQASSVANSAPILSSIASHPTTGSESSGYGFSYSPYNPDNSCKVQSQVDQDIDGISNQYSLVRIYGTRCNQTAMVLEAARRRGMKVFAVIDDLGNIDNDVDIIASAATACGGWDDFDTIGIGNELVNAGKAKASDVTSAISTARQRLQNLYGYRGKVVTVDTLVAVRANPSLCDASDYCAVNCHPFYDGGVTSDQSGTFITTQVASLRSVLANPNQQIVVTETGWPWKGYANGKAVPSVQDQSNAINSIMKAFSSTPGELILLSAYNDLWKADNEKTFAAEKYWGVYGDMPSDS